ncbi:DUF1007 family protein [Methylobacterium oryzihabitans]|uniref:DUF1007 family protein n=1 Tax=Methylobacterium oryzihabitans TaxID=2499852 RepID=A0A3S2YLG9_9HYPH|nr:DUF1007 family protein [Methylobacterium oryzihabitans]RVU13834.1 DUF1007 family protein [Methylobacterium oryzihabitans]
MTIRSHLLLLASAGLGLAAAAPAAAHPHVWITTKAEIVYGPDGRVTGLRHAWTFDPSYSALTVQGLERGGDGAPSPQALAVLARENIESLGDSRYFTALKVSGRPVEVGAPEAPAMGYADGALTLSFTLPLKAPAGPGALSLEVFDPTYFVAFSLAEGDGVATLSGAPAGCRATVHRPRPQAADAKSAGKSTDKPAAGMSEAFFEALTAASTYGVQFANRIVVACS